MRIRTDRPRTGAPVSVAPTSGGGTAASSVSGILHRELQLTPTWGLGDKQTLFAELAAMLEAGLGLQQALELVQESLKRSAAASVGRIREGYLDGTSLAELFRGEGFTAYEVQAIEVGERANELTRVCASVASFHGRMLALRGKITSALSYPLFVLTLSGVIVYFLLRYLVPMFADTFAQSGLELPWLTRQVQASAEALGRYGPPALLAAIISGGTAFALRRRVTVRRAAGWLKLHLPVARAIYVNLALAKACQSLAVLLANGVDLSRALTLTAPVTGIYQLERSFDAIADGILAGRMTWEGFADSGVVSRRFVALVRIAEASHTLPATFSRLAQDYERAADASSDRLKTFIEPVMILGLGLVVGVILVAMYLPLFSLTSLGRG